MTGADSRRGGAPEPISDVLQRVMRTHVMRTAKPAARRGGIAETWAAAAGDLAAETRPATLQRGILTVEVRSAALLAELEGFRKDELLRRLLEADGSGRITGLRFRLGVF